MINGKVKTLIRNELGVELGPMRMSTAIRHVDDDLMPSLIEATFIAAREMIGNYTFSEELVDSLESGINEVMNEHRISYKLVEGRVIEFQSMELHNSVVEPTLRLLSGLAGWGDVETAYQDALREISRSSPHDAITDAGRALQEALTLLGCGGNTIGKLVASARRKGLLGPHDSALTDGIEKIAAWVSADRNESGDSHKAATGITTDDAWLTVHVVGALILRLAQGPRTNQP